MNTITMHPLRNMHLLSAVPVRNLYTTTIHMRTATSRLMNFTVMQW
jgi:hypothetical protein